MRRTSRRTASRRISACDHSTLFLLVAGNQPSPRRIFHTFLEPKIRRVQRVVVRRPGGSVSCSTDGGGKSLPQGSYLKYICSSCHTHHPRATSVANDGARSVMPALTGKVVDIAFQGYAARAFGDYHRQPMMEARSLGSSPSASPVKDLKVSSESTTHGQHLRVRRRCDDVHGGYTCRVVDQTPWISHSTLPKLTAHLPCTWSQRRHPRVTCHNGNGDVKPDHPSGPGTYGHVV